MTPVPNLSEPLELLTRWARNLETRRAAVRQQLDQALAATPSESTPCRLAASRTADRPASRVLIFPGGQA